MVLTEEDMAALVAGPMEMGAASTAVVVVLAGPDAAASVITTMKVSKSSPMVRPLFKMHFQP
jgi:hypothetical protein